MNRSAFAAISLVPLIAGCSDAPPELPPGYKLVSQSIDLPTSYMEQHGNVQVRVRRRWESAATERMLSIAEALYPTEEAIDSVLRRRVFPRDDLRPAVPPADTSLVAPRWWIGEKNGELVPFAVTAAGLAYYLRVIERIWDQRRGYGREDPPGPSHTFEYTASVSSLGPSWGSRGMYLVHLRMTRTVGCEPLRGDRWVLERRAVMTPDGDVIEVQGDGMPFGGSDPTSCPREHAASQGETTETGAGGR